MLVKVVRRVSAPFMGYLFLLVASALLGLFVEHCTVGERDALLADKTARLSKRPLRNTFRTEFMII